MSHDIVTRAIEKAMLRVRTAFRTVLTGISSASPIQLIQADGLAGEQLQDNELMQHYGFTSVPPVGSQMVVLPIGGRTAHGIVIATEHMQFRLKALQNGEAALYDDLGQQIVLTRQGIVIKGAGRPITITDTPSVTLDTPVVHATGSLQVDGNITAQGDILDHGNKSMAGMRTAYNGHRHGGSTTPDAGM